MADGTQESPEEMFPVSNALGSTINESMVMPKEMLPGAAEPRKADEPVAAAPSNAKESKKSPGPLREKWRSYGNKTFEFVQEKPYAVAAGVAGAGFAIGLFLATRRRRREIIL